MKKYLVCINETDSGCDYTIDCGKTFFELEVESLIDVYKYLEENYGGNNGEVIEKWNDVNIYEITIKYTREDILKEVDEYINYLKLKSKFEGVE